MTYRAAIISLLMIAMMGVSTEAFAQKRKGGGKAKPSSAGETGAVESSTTKQTNYDFDDDLVSGDLVRPDGEQLVVRRRGERRSLVRLREHFIPEMLKSVEDL